MEVTLDSAGRLVIPRDIRREARLEPGILLDIRLTFNPSHFAIRRRKD